MLLIKLIQSMAGFLSIICVGIGVSTMVLENYTRGDN